MVEVPKLDKELRHMPGTQVLALSRILDIDDGWKTLMSVIKNLDNPVELKYSGEQIRLVEDAAEKQKRSCSEILFEEWGTSGKIRPKFSNLCQFLVEAELFRAAEYVHHDILRNTDKLERPKHGPAAITVSESIDETFSTQSNVTDITLVDNFSNSQLTDSCHGGASNQPTWKIGDYQPSEYKYKDLELWTDNFSQRLGHGAFGSVYLCNVPEPKIQVAVKRLQLNITTVPTSQLPNQFHNEITTLTKFKHENVLSLLGYSSDGPDLCLVYDYMPNGSLEDKIKVGSVDLEWNVRLDIALGTAKGIHYLHTFPDKPHIHRDIKSANILLDINLKPKLGDFGLARAAPMETIATTTIVGTTAYMAPEALRGDICIKMDVFSFGVVILELVTGLLAWDENRESRSLVSYIDDIDNIATLIDTKPKRDDDELPLNLYCVSQKCLQEKKLHRPHIEAVLQDLFNIPRINDS